MRDVGKHILQVAVFQNIDSSNANHCDALAGQPFIPTLIVCKLPGILMPSSIDLDGYPRSRTVEIENIGTDGVLPAKLQPLQLTATQFLPEQYFRQCHLPAQCAGTLECQD